MLGDSYWPSLWSTIELNICIVCACLPLMRPLARKFGDLNLGRYIPSLSAYLPSMRSTKGFLSTRSGVTNNSQATTVVNASPSSAGIKKFKKWYANMDDTMMSTTIAGTTVGGGGEGEGEGEVEGEGAGRGRGAGIRDVEAGIHDGDIYDVGIAKVEGEGGAQDLSGGNNIQLQDLSGLAAEPNDVTAYHPWSTSPPTQTQITVTHVIDVKDEDEDADRRGEESGDVAQPQKTKTRTKEEQPLQQQKEAADQMRRRESSVPASFSGPSQVHTAQRKASLGRLELFPRSGSPTTSNGQSYPSSFSGR